MNKKNKWSLRLINLSILYCGLLVLNNILTESGRKILAQEYDVPMDVIPFINCDLRYFPIPHTEHFVTTDRGEDLTLITSYYGLNFFNDKNIEKYLSLGTLKDELESRGYYDD